VSDELRQAVDALAYSLRAAEADLRMSLTTRGADAAAAGAVEQCKDLNGRYLLLDARAAYVTGLAALEATR
jgi:hypothetical protein